MLLMEVEEMKPNPSSNRLSFSPRNCTLNDKDAIKHHFGTPFRNVAPSLSDPRHPSWNSFQMKAFMRALCVTAVFNLSWCPITGHAIREDSHFQSLIGFRGLLRKSHFARSLELQILIWLNKK
ncbi:hypothetical protein CDAR_498031 [Caerostris darwini]|uniref:Uncharacterized protein n=1 Tax=Caerostris darwini TaxID=1538125 RepID=A0AAV4X2G4_9ARAC|nr:hypothetical protein CDAR_498031 [Caerostris darwini]